MSITGGILEDVRVNNSQLACYGRYNRRGLKKLGFLCGSKPSLQTGSQSLKAMGVYHAEDVSENSLLSYSAVNVGYVLRGPLSLLL